MEADESAAAQADNQTGPAGASSSGEQGTNEVTIHTRGSLKDLRDRLKQFKKRFSGDAQKLQKVVPRLEHGAATEYDKGAAGLDKHFEGTAGQFGMEMLNGALDNFNVPGMLLTDPLDDPRPLWQKIKDGEYSSYGVDPIHNPRLAGSLLGSVIPEVGGLGEWRGARSGLSGEHGINVPAQPEGIRPAKGDASLESGSGPKTAMLGKAASNDYKKTYFNAYPELRGKVRVHHAVERQVLKKFPGVITEAEMQALTFPRSSG
jgi:hypothetical protein